MLKPHTPPSIRRPVFLIHHGRYGIRDLPDGIALSVKARQLSHGGMAVSELRRSIAGSMVAGSIAKVGHGNIYTTTRPNQYRVQAGYACAHNALFA